MVRGWWLPQIQQRFQGRGFLKLTPRRARRTELAAEVAHGVRALLAKLLDLWEANLRWKGTGEPGCCSWASAKRQISKGVHSFFFCMLLTPPPLS